MVGIAFRMLVDNKLRLGITVTGISTLFFLSAAQIGLLVGWCSTTSAIIRHTDADIWVMAKQTPAFDYGTAIPKIRVDQVRNAKGVRWAEGMFMAWNTWQRPDGRRINIELIGLDESCVGCPWNLREGHVESIHRPESVIVDELYLPLLGVTRIGDEVEMYGERAVIGAISRKIRTFTASPFVFTSIKSARKYDKRYFDDEVTYVLARCADGYAPEQVRDAILANVPNVACLTKSEFSLLTIKYWMLETGVGITVVVTAVLGFLVAAVVISQTLYAITQDHLPNYATLLAIGFGRWQLVAVVLTQAAILGTLGTMFGSVLFGYVSQLTQSTPIPIEITPSVFAGVFAGLFGCCLSASYLSVRSIFRIDPVTVFRN